MQCQYIKSNKKTCHGNAMIGSKYCYLHNFEIPEKHKAEARSRGGKNKIIKMLNPLKERIEINTSNDISMLINYLINEVLSNQLDLRIATGVTYMANCLLKVFEISDLEKRVEAIEKFTAK